MKEKILCAAIKLEEPYKGTVICGYRHDRCIDLITMIDYKIKVTQKMQGFLTSTERWVSRKTAFNIAVEAGQISIAPNKKDVTKFLISEDLY